MKKILIPFFCATLFSVNAFAQNNKTSFKTETTKNNLTINQVLDKYYTALGGKQNLKNVKSIVIEGSIIVQSNTSTIITKRMGNKLKVIATNQGQESMRIFDGERGFMVNNGQRKDMSIDEIRDLQTNNTIEALELDKSNMFSNSSLENLEGKKYNVLTATNGKYYFDVSTGLLYKTIFGNTETIIKDYVVKDGIKFATSMETLGSGKKILYKIKRITLNSGVSEGEFN